MTAAVPLGVAVALAGLLCLAAFAATTLYRAACDDEAQRLSAEAALESAEDELIHARAAVRGSAERAAALESECASVYAELADAQQSLADHVHWRALTSAICRRTGIALPEDLAENLADDLAPEDIPSDGGEPRHATGTWDAADEAYQHAA